MKAYQQQFIDLALDRQALRFGSFELKSGRISPYFFNAGQFDDGASLDLLGRCYAQAIVDSGVAFDMLFGPAYKGIPLAASVAIALAREHGRNLPWAYNRKEAKDHGEGGQLVGAPLEGRVLVVDDVISAGTSVRESVGWIEQAGASLAGVLIALDRQETGPSGISAVAEVQQSLGAPVTAIINLHTLIRYVEEKQELDVDIAAIQRYRDQYGG